MINEDDVSFHVMCTEGKRKAYRVLVGKPEETIWKNNIVTCIPIARQRLGKHIPMQANVRNNRASIARQQINKHTSLTIKAVFSVWSVQSGCKDVFGSIEQ
jgi:hypothetical protein